MNFDELSQRRLDHLNSNLKDQITGVDADLLKQVVDELDQLVKDNPDLTDGLFDQFVDEKSAQTAAVWRVATLTTTALRELIPDEPRQSITQENLEEFLNHVAATWMEGIIVGVLLERQREKELREP